MKTVHKLILKSYAGPMVLTFFIVLFVFIMQFMWRYIDELVGKGLGMDVILELMMYAAVTLIPMVLPLATLFAAVMVAYVFVHFMKFFFGTPKAAKVPKARPEVPAALTVEVTE